MVFSLRQVVRCYSPWPLRQQEDWGKAGLRLGQLVDGCVSDGVGNAGEESLNQFDFFHYFDVESD